MKFKHARWVKYIIEYCFIRKHKFGIENKVHYALNYVGYLLQTMKIEVLGFDKVKASYNSYPDLYHLFT